MTRLFSVGHGTASIGELTALLSAADVQMVVDVRSIPRSRRHPQYSRDQLEQSMPEAALGYRWEPGLGGFRRAAADSPNVALSLDAPMGG